MKPAAFRYDRPASLAAAMADLVDTEGEPRVIAGGQSLGPMLNLRLALPGRLVDISRLSDLTASALEDDRLVIGACVTHARIEDGDIPDATLGLMRHVAKGIAYRAVRNRGTIGGSLAHADPAADWVMTMIALDASVHLARDGGERVMQVTDLVTGPLTTALAPGEVITSVLVPRLSRNARWGHAKFAHKLGDFAQSMAIAVIDRDRNVSRAVLGRRADIPALLRHTAVQMSAEQMSRPPTDDKLVAAVEADLASLHVDPQDWTLHRAMILRAVKDATK
jgi:aerobic carbon-monoxide dehydrogenase medium subunit